MALASACNAMEQPAPDPVLVLESPGSKSEAGELIIIDLSGRELFRQSTGTADALPSLHAASAQVAFWRGDASGAAHELVVWDIATRALKILATSAIRPAMSPLWSVDGTEVLTLHTTTSLSYAPGVAFEGKAEISVATVATGQYRTLATDRPLIPSFADGTIVAGRALADDKVYVVVDARSGRVLREVWLNSIGVLPAANPDVLIAMLETATPGVVTFQVLNARTGVERSRLGPVYAQPMPSWPGRNEVVFVDAGELRAFDYVTNATRVVGRFDGASFALAFDPLGEVLLAARPIEPFYGTFAVSDGRLTSAIRVPGNTSFLSPLGLVRVKL